MLLVCGKTGHIAYLSMKCFKMQDFFRDFIRVFYDNTPMQQTVTFSGCKNGKFWLKIEMFIYLYFAQNIDRKRF